MARKKRTPKEVAPNASQVLSPDVQKVLSEFQALSATEKVELLLNQNALADYFYNFVFDVFQMCYASRFIAHCRRNLVDGGLEKCGLELDNVNEVERVMVDVLKRTPTLSSLVKDGKEFLGASDFDTWPRDIDFVKAIVKKKKEGRSFEAIAKQHGKTKDAVVKVLKRFNSKAKSFIENLQKLEKFNDEECKELLKALKPKK